jgi:stress-induced morphogen
MSRRILTSTALATVFLTWAGAGHATNIVVNDQTEGFVNNQLCSLREAVEALNTQTPTLPANGNDCPAGNGINDTITINAGTYPDFNIFYVERSVVIAGAGMTSTIIQAGGPIGFFPQEGTTVTIRDLAGDGDHYAAKVLAESFRGKSRVQQHQIVYAALKGEMGGALHALALQTGVPE